MAASAPLVCWICRQRRADSAEHRFKASDIRAKVPGLSQRMPVFLQRGAATNVRIGGAKADALKFKPTICAHCNNAGTQRYDRAWQRLSEYLHTNWAVIARRRQFDLSKPFPGGTRDASLDVHLFFLKLFGCKIVEDSIPIDLTPLSRALLYRHAHPEISLNVVDTLIDKRVVAAYDSDVYAMRNNRTGELDGATWLYDICPVGVKVSYIRGGSPLYVRGDSWHPSRPRKFIRLSPFHGGTEPKAGSKAILSP